ncbi:MAG: hypothetical protein HRU40_16960 [Saprospiraceae bacterium]|nr:hypothetical protein [Saprospiraceae bacterium]
MNFNLIKKETENMKNIEKYPSNAVLTFSANNSGKSTRYTIHINKKASQVLKLDGSKQYLIHFNNFQVTNQGDESAVLGVVPTPKVPINNKNYKAFIINTGTKNVSSKSIYNQVANNLNINLDETTTFEIELFATEDFTAGAFTYSKFEKVEEKEDVSFDKGENVSIEIQEEA